MLDSQLVDKFRRQRDLLLVALTELLEQVPTPPDSNCSCHISPPCNDCVEYRGLREAVTDANKVISIVNNDGL